uniref:Putative secreted protein n=1 Tax=Ixodes ricinus TaxID=34613 RepID=A0A147BFL2_IXORI
MKVQTKLIIVGTVMILHAIQKGVLSQEPSPSPCYDAIKAVGEIFCTITGQHGFMNFLWPPYPKIYVILCKDVYFNLSIPFKVTDVEIITCPEYLKKKFDIWRARWSENKIQATKALCDRSDRHRGVDAATPGSGAEPDSSLWLRGSVDPETRCTAGKGFRVTTPTAGLPGEYVQPKFSSGATCGLSR